MAIRQVATGIIRNSEGKICLTRRCQHRHQGGLWEFPGGKLAAGETPFEGLKRELAEETGIMVTAATLVDSCTFDYGDKAVALYFFRIDTYEGVPSGCEGQPLVWVPVQQLAEYPMPQANEEVIRRLLNGEGL